MTNVDSYFHRYLIWILLVLSVWSFSGICFAVQNTVLINDTNPTQKQLSQLGVKLVPKKRYWYDAEAGLIGLEGREMWQWVTPGLKIGKLRSNASYGDTLIFFNGRELPDRELAIVELEIKKKLKRGRYWLTADGSGGLAGGPRLFKLQRKIVIDTTKSYSKDAIPQKTKIIKQRQTRLKASKELPYRPKSIQTESAKIEKPLTKGSFSGTSPAASVSSPKIIAAPENDGSDLGDRSTIVEGIPQLPQPMPKWTSRYLLPDSVVFSGNDEETLGDVFDRIEEAMRRAEMYSWSAYSIVDDGFALITQLEAIDDSGAPRAAPNRWAFDSESSDSFSIADYFKSLFKSDPGRYRVIVLAITHRNLETETEESTSEQLQQLLRDGATALPPELRKKLLQEQTRCIGYVYEFERTSNSVTQIDTSNLQVIDHLSAGGYWERQNLQ